MEDTDWRPSPCPVCGFSREAARHPVCNNPECKCYGLPGEPGEPRTMTLNTKKRYLWIRPKSVESPMLIVDDPIALFRGNQFDEENDQLFEIGPEVKLEVNVKVVPTKPVYREKASGYRVPFENRD